MAPHYTGQFFRTTAPSVLLHGHHAAREHRSRPDPRSHRLRGMPETDILQRLDRQGWTRDHFAAFSPELLAGISLAALLTPDHPAKCDSQNSIANG